MPEDTSHRRLMFFFNCRICNMLGFTETVFILTLKSRLLKFWNDGQDPFWGIHWAKVFSLPSLDNWAAWGELWGLHLTVQQGSHLVAFWGSWQTSEECEGAERLCLYSKHKESLSLLLLCQDFTFLMLSTPSGFRYASSDLSISFVDLTFSATRLRNTEKFIYEMNIPKEKRRLEIWGFFFPTCLVQVLMY